MKYLKLKNQLGGAARFETCPNDGIVTVDGRQYRNSCIWISIHDYLTKVLGYTMTIDEMTRSTNLRCNSEFDVSSNNLDPDVMRIAQLFYLEIVLKRSFRRRDGILRLGGLELQSYNRGQSNHKVYIAYNGGHFELITKSRDLDFDTTLLDRENYQLNTYYDITSLINPSPCQIVPPPPYNTKANYNGQNIILQGIIENTNAFRDRHDDYYFFREQLTRNTTDEGINYNVTLANIITNDNLEDNKPILTLTNR